MKGASVQNFSEMLQTLVADSSFTERELQELLGSTDSMHELLSGLRAPTLYEATLLGAFFKVDPSVLMQGKSPSMGVSLRLGAVDGISGVGAVVEHATKLLSVDRITREWGFEEPVTDLPDFSPSRKWNYRQAGENTAVRLRAYLDLEDTEPVADLTGLVESLGYPVEYRSLPNDVHGISVPEVWGQQTAWVILINCNDNWARQRFTLAHELSHVLQGDAGQVIVDRAVTEDRGPERIADSFARNFLLPEEALESIFSAHRPIRSHGQLADLVTDVMLTYGVSRDATVYALRETGIGSIDPNLLDSCARASVADMMRISGRQQQWLEMVEVAGRALASERLTKQTLDAYGDGLTSFEAVADVIAGGNLDRAETLLRDAGWEDLASA
ncbi:ImmA/IrrE family metallo-endopeptidase [Streptomyces sp. NPDC094458]|uniref:ImmA/IrrE family metallo-endopeptidase n=1 Tax=Streptomyces sp. NPDC094458 TaxID=3155208 RepID=UPI0033316ABC